MTSPDRLVDPMLPAILVIAKEPVPGRSKTRLTPPCTPAQAATIARASLQDTLTAVAATPASARVVVLDGDADGWVPDGFTVIPQRGAGLDQRLAAAFEDGPSPALLIGMDTPQVTAKMLTQALTLMVEGGAVLGEAWDGGFWAVGIHGPNRALFEGVPMSVASTCTAQRERFDALGIPYQDLPVLRDVDTFSDALIVAAAPAGPCFTEAVAQVREAIA